jgi:hypothetical protein
MVLYQETPVKPETLLKQISIYDRPNLKVSNSLFNISGFFYKYSLIKKLLQKNNYFYYDKNTIKDKFHLANLKRFEKDKRKFCIINGDKIKDNMESFRTLINGKNIKKLSN